jgi:hypothetical protein
MLLHRHSRLRGNDKLNGITPDARFSAHLRMVTAAILGTLGLF